MSDLVELREQILKFRDDRNWQQFHNPKDLALSISLEASELLELFQWKTSEEAVEKNLEKMKEELADVLIYSILFANETGMDLNSIIQEKLDKNTLKYPVDKSYGKKEKYTSL
ncbi:nucleotide pyrophosphohydrolase [Lysinibacillus fusiformis]|uniref:nucleotide pyrophosphohydrolase n=1 Tax=Lysinibacillus fusiformis TaxID=28031 RepID=UPI001880D1A0|nr:nucleotide pyrophosphohydrolase [Lysinibacillus fusiformis]MBD8522728.1 nucleotide pyrophosphohydrolase [Lysinibacillus fusiformis]